MTRNLLLASGVAAGIATGLPTAGQAQSLTAPQAQPPTVKLVTLSYEAESDKSCPRKIVMRASAFTDGPGPVNFVIRKAGGGASGQLAAVAKMGPRGKYLATFTQRFTIAKSERTKYMAETGPGKISKWITFDETCTPPRVPTDTGGSSKPDGGKPVPTGDNPRPGGKPTCKGTISFKRPVVSKLIGVPISIRYWEDHVETVHGPKFGDWSSAKDKRVSCAGIPGAWYCSISAKPCSKR